MSVPPNAESVELGNVLEAAAVQNAAEEENPWADNSPGGAKAPAAAAKAPAAKAPGGMEVEAPKAADIFMLARQQNFTIVAKLLEAYPQFWDSKDEDGHSLVHWAALVGSNDFITVALARNSSFVEASAANKQTPIMWSVLRGHVATTKLLLDAKANIAHKDSLGATALMIAIQHKQYQTMLLLMHRGDKRALVIDSDKNGCTSGHWAAYKGDLTALRFLDYFGADLNSVDGQKMLPMHRATAASHHQVIQFLMERRSDPLARNSDDESCLDIAAKNNDQAMQTVFKQLMTKHQCTKGSGNQVAPDLESGTESTAGGGMQETPGVFKDRAAQKIFPVFWLVCVSLAVFQYLMDLRRMGMDVAPVASMCFEIGIPLSLAVFFFVALSDPGKVPAKPRGHSGVEEVMRALDGQLPADGKMPDVNRLCTTTWVLKGLRTKYCNQTGACVEEFDHYCVWLNCAIGKGNHRQFVLLALVEFFTQVSHLYVLWCLCTKLVAYETFGAWLFGIATGYPLLLLIAVAHSITAPWVFMLFLHQSRLIVMNMTTNEMLNAHRYEHFWIATSVTPGRMQKHYRNPFTKGGAFGNCLDFWWFRRRSDAVNMDAPAVPSCTKSNCKSCEHH